MASATSITLTTPDGSMAGGLPVSASATFVTGTDLLTITLTNLQANPTSVVQNLSDILFFLSGGLDTGSLTSSSGVERTIASNGTYSDGASVVTGWDLESTAGGLHLNLLGTSTAPEHTIVGPPGISGYSNANASIAGNDPHNPFLAESAVFTLNIPGLTADDTVSRAVFSFGTAAGNDVETGPPVPEPASLLLLGSGLIGLAIWRYKR